jgi:hypothetical protein
MILLVLPTYQKLIFSMLIRKNEKNLQRDSDSRASQS